MAGRVRPARAGASQASNKVALMYRIVRLGLVALLSFVLGFTFCNWRQSRQVAAQVNNELILSNELRQELQKRFGADVLRDLVHQRLILQEARRKGIKVDEKAIDGRLQEMKKQPQVAAMLKSGETSEADLRRNLSTLAPLDALVQSQIGAQEEAEYLQAHRDELESLVVEHILLLDGEAAAEIAAEAKKPKADFHALAKQHSLDERTKNQGGRLGEIHRSEIEPEVAELLFSLKEGQVSPPVQGEDGFHVFRVVKRRTALEDLRVQIRELLVSARRGEYLEELRAAAKIQAIPPYRLPTSLPSPLAGD